MNDPRSQRTPTILLITGADTGVGKTVFTALLLEHARSRGLRALALKPLCTGGRDDALLLSAIQEHDLPLDTVNPWWSDIPLTPAIAFRNMRKKPNKHAVLEHIRAVAERAEILLVEGAGGLMSPLCANANALDLALALRCPVVVVARNRLGCLNHILMTVKLLRDHGLSVPAVVLNPEKNRDLSARSNLDFLRKMADFPPVFELPWMGARAGSRGAVKKNAKILKKTLARILASAKKRAALWQTKAGEGRSNG